MNETPPYAGEERRQQHPQTLSDAQIEEIAERAATKAVERITRDAYAAVGKGVVQKAMWIIGVLAVAAFVWASQHGLIHPKP